jgi:hypothetical protein
MLQSGAIKNKSGLDTIITEQSRSSKEEAAQCLLRNLYFYYEDLFVSVAIDKCLIRKKSISGQKWMLLAQR